MGQSEAVTILEKTLNEEKETDAKLTKLAERINVEAMDSAESGAYEKALRKTKHLKRSATA